MTDSGMKRCGLEETLSLTLRMSFENICWESCPLTLKCPVCLPPQRVAGLGRLKEAGRRDAISRAMQRDLEVARLVLGDDAEMVSNGSVCPSLLPFASLRHGHVSTSWLVPP